MERGIENEKTTLMQSLGVPFVGLVGKDEGQAVLLRALSARALGERAIARGDEVLLIGARSAAETEALRALGMVDIKLPADADASALERTLSPATRAVWVCEDATADTVFMTRNFCNALDLWMLATVALGETRRCAFEGEVYHVGAVADVATGAGAEDAFVCTKDDLPYRLMQQNGAK